MKTRHMNTRESIADILAEMRRRCNGAWRAVRVPAGFQVHRGSRGGIFLLVNGAKRYLYKSR